ARNAGRFRPRTVRTQPLLIGQVTLPRDISRESVALEHFPFGHRHRAHPYLAAAGGRTFRIDLPTTISISARIDGMMEYPAQQGARDGSPDQLATPRTLVDANSRADLVPCQVAVDFAVGT